MPAKAGGFEEGKEAGKEFLTDGIINVILSFKKRFSFMKSLKTAISIPEDIYQDAEKAAKRLGMSRSRLYSVAVADFLNRYRKDDITAKLNKVYDPGNSRIDPALTAMQFASLSQEEW